MSPKEKAVKAAMKVIADGTPEQIERALSNLYEKGYYAGWNNDAMGGTGDMAEEEDPLPKVKTRSEICNYCGWAKCPGLPDGIICDEPHHIEAGIRERHQCYTHHCEYYKDDGKTDIYNL